MFARAFNGVDLRHGAPVCRLDLDNGANASVNVTVAFKPRPVAFGDGQFSPQTGRLSCLAVSPYSSSQSW